MSAAELEATAEQAAEVSPGTSYKAFADCIQQRILAAHRFRPAAISRAPHGKR